MRLLPMIEEDFDQFVEQVYEIYVNDGLKMSRD